MKKYLPREWAGRMPEEDFIAQNYCGIETEPDIQAVAQRIKEYGDRRVALESNEMYNSHLPQLVNSEGLIHDVIKIMINGNNEIEVWTSNNEGQKHWTVGNGCSLQIKPLFAAKKNA